MSRAFLNRNSQNNSNSQQSNSSQQKVDYEAQMKKLDMDINNPGWNTTDISPAQLFAEEEEKRQAKANEEEELQMKPKGEVSRQKNTKTAQQENPPTVMHHMAEGHNSGYQHIFDENGNLIILYPVIGPDVFYITKEPDTIAQKGKNASVEVGSIEKVPIQQVKNGLYAYYKDRPKEELDFVDRLYRFDKNDGYDYVQHRSVRNLAQAHEDFFTGGGWMMIAVCMLPLIIEAIPFIIQTSPHLLSKMPRSLVIKALKTKTGQYFIKGTGESILDALIQYLFTEDVDLTSIGLNYVPGMGKTKTQKYIIEGLKLVGDASVDYKLKAGELETIIGNKNSDKVLIDLIAGTAGGAANQHIDEEFSKAVYRFILKGEFKTLTNGISIAIKDQFKNEEADKDK